MQARLPRFDLLSRVGGPTATAHAPIASYPYPHACCHVRLYIFLESTANRPNSTTAGISYSTPIPVAVDGIVATGRHGGAIDGRM